MNKFLLPVISFALVGYLALFIGKGNFQYANDRVVTKEFRSVLERCVKDRPGTIAANKLSKIYNAIFSAVGGDTLLEIITNVGRSGTLDFNIRPIGVFFLDTTVIIIHDKVTKPLGGAFYHAEDLDTIAIRKTDIVHRPKGCVIWHYRIKGNRLEYFYDPLSVWVDDFTKDAITKHQYNVNIGNFSSDSLFIPISQDGALCTGDQPRHNVQTLLPATITSIIMQSEFLPATDSLEVDFKYYRNIDSDSTIYCYKQKHRVIRALN